MRWNINDIFCCEILNWGILNIDDNKEYGYRKDGGDCEAKYKKMKV